jgi:GST-like protein
MTMLELYGCRGCGSAVIEALLEWSGVPYRYCEVEPWKGGPETEALAALNPLAQVPTVRFADGAVMTESAAIVLALAEQHPAARMLPHVGDPMRLVALRWIAFIAGNLYPAISVGDFPERWVKDAAAQEELKQGARERLQHYWRVMEQHLKPAPYLAGHEMSALDIYAAMLSRWRPGRAWVEENCPKVARAIALAERQPFLARVWERNFFRSQEPVGS